VKKTIYSDEYGKLIEWLKAKRIAKGLTQRDLAMLLECDNATVARIETCQRRLDLVEYVQICEFLGCDPAEGLKVVSG